MNPTSTTTNIKPSEPSARATLRLSNHQLLDKFYSLATGEDRLLFLRSCGLSNDEIERLWLRPTFAEKDDYLRSLFARGHQSHRTQPTRSRVKEDGTVIDITVTEMPDILPSPIVTESNRFAMVKYQPPVSTGPTSITAPPQKESVKEKWPDDVLPIVCANARSDRAATIYASRVKKWIPAIKEFQMYSTFVVVGLLNGVGVNLIAYVNRVGKSLYIGDQLIRHGAGCRVKWRQEVLGRLPFKGEKFPLTVINITARNLLT